MKITVLHGAFLPVPAIRGGAIGKAWNALSQEFVRAGNEVTQISRRCDGLARDEQIGKIRHLRVDGFETTRNPILLKWKEFFYVWRARKVLPRADILVTHAFWAPILFSKKKYGRIYVHVGRYPKGQFKFYSKASRFQVPTQAIAEAVKSEIPDRGQSISVLPYPLDWKVDSKDNFSDRPQRILYLGRIHPEKGVYELIRSFKNIPSKKRRGWRLTIRGPWRTGQGGGGQNYMDKLKGAIKNRSSEIEILDPTFSSSELKNDLENTRLFAYPSLAEKGETFGLSVLEAMSCGCVPIVSALECFRDFVKPQKNGYVFDHRCEDIEKTLSLVLRNAIHSPTENQVFSALCSQRAKEYELERLSKKYLQDFSRLLATKDS
jgi:glycosyltransferase involved in cell wall biosynthesis